MTIRVTKTYVCDGCGVASEDEKWISVRYSFTRHDLTREYCADCRVTLAKLLIEEGGLKSLPTMESVLRAKFPPRPVPGSAADVPAKTSESVMEARRGRTRELVEGMKDE